MDARGVIGASPERSRNPERSRTDLAPDRFRMDLMLYIALVPTLGGVAQWLAWRLGLPAILILLLFGVVLGQFVRPDTFLANLTGGDETAGPRILFPIVALAVAVIMFEGGLSLKLRELSESGAAALRLVTVGAAITWFGGTLAAYWTLGFPWRLSLLLGAILVVTGPTVIGPLLHQIRPSRRVSSTLKWESIVIDPIGAVLAVLVFEQAFLHAADASVGSAIKILLVTVAVGLGTGVAAGWLMSRAFRRFWVPDHLHGVVVLSLALLLFAVSDQMAHESGLITVTVFGIWLANQKHSEVEHIIELKENLRTLLIGCLFIILGSRIEVGNVWALGVPGLSFLAVLILIVRPLSVFGSLVGTSLTFREQAFIAGLAPRGIVAAAVSSVFALELEQRVDGGGLAGAEQLGTVTFLVIVGTVTIYGILGSPLARVLGLSDQSSHGVLIAGADAWVRDLASELRSLGVPVLLVDTNYNKVSQAKMSGLNAVCANILNEHAREELNLSGIGRLLAMTPNDEVNSLALRESRGLFDRSRLYQLTFKARTGQTQRALTKNLLGRELFGEGQTFSAIQSLYEAGAKFKSTRLSDSFTFQDFLAKNGDQTIVLCALTEDRRMLINTVDDPLTPGPGMTIVSLATAVPVPPNHAGKLSAGSVT